MISDTAYLLKECNAGCRMATNSLQQAISHADDQRLCDLLHKYDREFDSFIFQNNLTGIINA